MNVDEILQLLYSEKTKIEDVIARLESIRDGNDDQSEGSRPSDKRRGRRSMGEAERRQVSARMMKYWAEWRQHKTAVQTEES